jgi:hypothetical protein
VNTTISFVKSFDNVMAESQQFWVRGQGHRSISPFGVFGVTIPVDADRGFGLQIDHSLMRMTLGFAGRQGQWRWEGWQGDLLREGYPASGAADFD